MPLPYLLIDGPKKARATIVLAHGAGAPMDSPFMQAFAEGLAATGFQVARFEFPYMAGRRDDGKKRPPDKAPVLLDTWKAVIKHFGPENLIIGGKSMGGRIASMVADEAGVKGLVCLGYPFHGPGREANETRLMHLKGMKTPTLICQGERDSMGTAEEVPGYPLSKAISVHWLGDGDHSLKPRVKSGRTEAQNWAEAITAIAGFAKSL